MERFLVVCTGLVLSYFWDMLHAFFAEKNKNKTDLITVTLEPSSKAQLSTVQHSHTAVLMNRVIQPQ